MFLGSRERPVHRADNLDAICEPILYTMWDPQHVTTLWASTACYMNSVKEFRFGSCQSVVTHVKAEFL
jgi:hypothetical protein